MSNVLISDWHDTHERFCKFIVSGSRGVLCLLCVIVSMRIPVSLSSNMAPLLAYPGSYSWPSLCRFYALIPPFPGSRRDLWT